MRILYLADPNSIHDVKWISYISDANLNKAYILPRASHVTNENTTGPHTSGAKLLKSISDFSILRFYQTLVTSSRIKSIIRKYSIDLIHVLYAEPNALWSLFRNYFGVPMIISCRGTDVLKTIPEAFERKGLLSLLVAAAYKRAFLNADWVTGTSKTQLKSISSFSTRAEKFSIIRTGVDMNRLEERAELPSQIEKGSKYILFPRYIHPVYNHEFCLAAIDLLPAAFKNEYKMVFIGRDSGDNSYQQVLEKKMKEISTVKFIFLEKQSQKVLFELYRRALLVVMTPLSDGSPVSAMEAILCGAKVILGPLAYDREVFSDNVTILKSWSAGELKDSMMAILEGKKVDVEIAADRRKLMDRDYNMKALLILYKNLLAK